MNDEWEWEEFEPSKRAGESRWRYRRKEDQYIRGDTWLFLEHNGNCWVWWRMRAINRRHLLMAAQNLEEAKALAIVEWRMK